MGRWRPVKRRDFIKKLKKLGFEAPEPGGSHFPPTLQKPRMLQIQGVRGCSCSVLPQTLGNEGYAVSSAFPQGKKHASYIKILEFTRDRFYISKLNLSEAVHLLSFMALCHVFYATLGFYTRHGTYTLTLPNNKEFSIPQLKMLINEIEHGIRKEISIEEWENF